MRKKKNKIKASDEVVVFADEMSDNQAEQSDGEAVFEEAAEVLDIENDTEAETESETEIEQELSDGFEEEAPKLSFFEKIKLRKNKTNEAQEPQDEPDSEEYAESFEQSEGTVIDIDAQETELTAHKEKEQPFEDISSKAVFEYSRAEDDLPTAVKSDDVYADIVKNIDETLHEERTSRRVKYEREQGFIDTENPFQRNRDNDLDGEENLSYDEINRKQLKTFDEMFASFKSKIFPQKGEKKTEVIRKLVANTSIVVLVCCAVAFAVIFIQSKQAEKQQLGLSSQIVDITSAEEEAQLWEDFRAKYPHIKTPEGMMAKYAYLYAINQQLAGWVSIPNSGIDVQVVQAQNNTDYLKKDFYGNYSRYGCPFMDYRNDAKYLNQNTIIYGHHMSDGLIFAELSKYKELDGFLESPIIRFDTLYKSYYFKVYAAFITNSREEDDNGYIFNYTVTSFASPQNFDGFIAALDERKLYTTGVDINSGDKLITLSTCTYEFNDARLVIVGRMLRTGETVDIDTTYATKNGNPHYPQVWYDKNGKTNPFAGATKWYPEG